MNVYILVMNFYSCVFSPFRNFFFKPKISFKIWSENHAKVFVLSFCSSLCEFVHHAVAIIQQQRFSSITPQHVLVFKYNGGLQANVTAMSKLIYDNYKILHPQKTTFIILQPWRILHAALVQFVSHFEICRVSKPYLD